MTVEPNETATETLGTGVELHEFVARMAPPDSPVWRSPRIGRPRRSPTGEPLPPSDDDKPTA